MNKQRLVVDEELAAAFVASLRKTSKRLGMEDDLGSASLLSLPGVVKFEELQEDADQVWPLIRKALNGALKALLDMKTVEGAALAKDLTSRYGHLEKRVQRIEKRAPQVVKTYRKNLLKRVAEAGVEMDLGDDRLLRELALFADRSDISEEITRLHSHLEQAAKIMKRVPPTGKSLDFLAQEMFREINTIGSKANDAAILTEVVEFKAELERVREQVQNIE